MKVGTEILRNLSLFFRRLEDDIALINWLDQQLTASRTDGEIDSFLAEFAAEFDKLSDGRLAGIFFAPTGHYEIFSRTLELDPRHAEEISSFLDNMNENSGLISFPKSKVAYFHIRLDASFGLNFAIVLKGNYYGENYNDFENFEKDGSLKIIIERANNCLQNIDERTTQKLYRDLVNGFLRATRDGGANDSEGDAQLLDHRRSESWDVLARTIEEFIPSFGPYEHLERPRIQILSVEQSRTHLRLRTSSRSDGRIPPPRSNRFGLIRRDSSICGLILDDEDAGKPEAPLNIDPTDEKYSDRYASYLFQGGSPRSELAVPIREGKSRYCNCIINVEHPTEGIFEGYYLAKISHAIDIVSPFILNLYKQDTASLIYANQFRYILMRIFDRVSKIYRHHLKNDLAIANSSTERVRRVISRMVEQGGEIREEAASLFSLLDDILEQSSSIAAYSERFGEYLREFTIHKAIDIRSLIEEVAREAKLDSKFAGRNVFWSWPDIPSGILVYGSNLAREHIYNIISNSVDKINEATNLDRAHIGAIEVGYYLEESKDLAGKETALQYAVVSISDNGGGVPLSEEPDIFRFGHTSKRDRGGWGFGLPACRDYMESLNGDLEFVNRFPIGVTVKLKFPIFEPSLHDAMAKLMNIG